MKPASKDKVGGMAVNAFLPSKIVAFLGKEGLLKLNCLGRLHGGQAECPPWRQHPNLHR